MKAALYKLLPYLLAPLYWFLSRTWRIVELGQPEILDKFVERREPALFAHWHGDELVLVGYYSYRNLAVLSSLSQDGSLMARTLGLLGYQVFRGSSSRGGARGLIGLIRAVRDGSQAALAVDGPKGPIYEVKPGIVDLGLKTGKPIVPARCFADNAWVFSRSWNKCYLPKPFSRVYVIFGEPLVVEEKKPDLNEFCKKVKAGIDVLSIPASGRAN